MFIDSTESFSFAQMNWDFCLFSLEGLHFKIVLFLYMLEAQH